MCDVLRVVFCVRCKGCVLPDACCVLWVECWLMCVVCCVMRFERFVFCVL